VPASDDNHDSVPPAARQFVTTHWTAVLSATGSDSTQARHALAELCQTYWYPLYAFIRRQGHAPHDAEDLTQEFFARLVEKEFLRAVRREKGRFRSFLLTALKRFLANEHDRATAQKRGGDRAVISIDHASAESRYELEPAHQVTPEVIFEQRWATMLLERVLERLREEYAATNRALLFGHLSDSLTKERDALPYAEIARELKMTEAAVKMAVQRLRRRYRELLREEIARTVASPDEIEAEIRHLFTTFSG